MRLLFLCFFATFSAFADGFVYAKGEFSQFSYPGSVETMAFGINDRNQIVGWYLDASFPYEHGFIKTESGFSSIDYPGAQGPFGTALSGINNSGTMVGKYWDGSENQGFVYNGGSFTTLAYPGAMTTQPFGINNHGSIVGFYWDGYATHGFLYERGQFTTLDVPGAVATQPYGINDKGQIIGGWNDVDGIQRGFLYERGAFTLTGVSSRYGINNRGQIAGDYYGRYGEPNGADALGINNHGYVVGRIR